MELRRAYSWVRNIKIVETISNKLHQLLRMNINLPLEADGLKVLRSY